MHPRRIHLFLVMAVLALLVSGLPGPDMRVAGAATSPPYVSEQIIFGLNNQADLNQVSLDYKLQAVTSLNIGFTYRANTTAGADPVQLCQAMSADSRVKFAEPNFLLSFTENAGWYSFDTGSTLNGLTTTTAANTASTQWAWKKTGLSTAHSIGLGAGVTVAVLDTGVDYTHPDLSGVTEKGFNVYDGGDGMDVNGHGTFVAGIIHQVAPKATILPIRVLDADGKASEDKILAGLMVALFSKAQVVNISFSSPANSKFLSLAISSLMATNRMVVASVGNENTSSAQYPASLPGVFGVASTNRQDNKTAFSNYGSQVNIGAPGKEIYSTFWKGGYGWASGTSFSAPIVTGAIALYLSGHPNASNSQVETALDKAVDPYPTDCLACQNSQMGYGRLDMSLLPGQ